MLSKGDRTRWDFYLEMYLIEFLNAMAHSHTKQGDYQNAMLKAKSFEDVVITILNHKL